MNLCITLNEFPFIRYYSPSHHPPLGPLKPSTSTRGQPPPETNSRWRTNLARGSEARAYESAEGDHVARVLAFMIQENLDEYKKQNPDFPVSSFFVHWSATVGAHVANAYYFRNLPIHHGRGPQWWLPIGLWIPSLPSFMNSRIKLWVTTFYLLRTARSTRELWCFHS